MKACQSPLLYAAVRESRVRDSFRVLIPKRDNRAFLLSECDLIGEARHLPSSSPSSLSTPRTAYITTVVLKVTKTASSLRAVDAESGLLDACFNDRRVAHCHSMASMSSSTKLESGAKPDAESGYFENIEDIRHAEYPHLSGVTYLDHAGTALYSKSLVEAWSKDLTSTLLGNPHSGTTASQLTASRIDDIRVSVLGLFDASPEDYDVVFVANASAAIKLVAEAFRDSKDGFWYGYHHTSHTSLMGVRELAQHGSRCFQADEEVVQWTRDLRHEHLPSSLKLFAYPAQSNMTGQRLPLEWSGQIRKACKTHHEQVYTLLDAAALVSTAKLSLADVASAPDFTCLSFYKIFGFPDLGALIVKRASSNVLLGKKYFAGGNVDMVTVGKHHSYARKTQVHEALEEGTLPFHNILALAHAIRLHEELFGSMSDISRHCGYLAGKARAFLRQARHANGRPACTIHEAPGCWDYGPVISFNLHTADGCDVSPAEVEKLSNIENIQLRTGGLCNPGGISAHLQLSDEDLVHNYARGYRCDGTEDVVHGKSVAAIRISFGACSSHKDLDNFVRFVNEYYIDRGSPEIQTVAPTTPRFYIESMSVFPIKSCASFTIPVEMPWPVHATGLAFDREWCLVHAGSGAAMSQKRFPRMALLQPEIDLPRRKLSVSVRDHPEIGHIEIDLDGSLRDHNSTISTCDSAVFRDRTSSVCGSNVDVYFYTAASISGYFSRALGTPCTLARFPSHASSVRYSALKTPQTERPKIKLANESPILLVSRSSVNKLNEDIKYNIREGRPRGKAVSANSFRGNIVVAERLPLGQSESPYAEDIWTSVSVEPQNSSEKAVAFQALGPCQRCQMVCVDQTSAQRGQEPFSTLSKTRKKDGKVWFGIHLTLDPNSVHHDPYRAPQLCIGDIVVPQPNVPVLCA